MFKVGDEVVCLNQETQETDDLIVEDAYIAPGTVCVVERVLNCFDIPVMYLFGYADLWQCRDFRKVEKRTDSLTIEAFSVIKDGGFEEPRREPAKTPAKEKA